MPSATVAAVPEPMISSVSNAAGSAVSVQPGPARSEFPALARQFAEEGFLVLRDVISKPRLEALRRAILEEFEHNKNAGKLFSGGGQMSGHLNCFPGAGSRFIYDELERTGVLDLLRQISPKSSPSMTAAISRMTSRAGARSLKHEPIFVDPMKITSAP